MKRWIKTIAGKDILCQSCWVDKDLDIIANISIGDGKEILHAAQIQISGNEITYLSSFKKLGKQISFAEYDNFLRGNLASVMDLIMSLLEPGELALLAKLQSNCVQLELFALPEK